MSPFVGLEVSVCERYCVAVCVCVNVYVCVRHTPTGKDSTLVFMPFLFATVIGVKFQWVGRKS